MRSPPAEGHRGVVWLFGDLKWQHRQHGPVGRMVMHVQHQVSIRIWPFQWHFVGPSCIAAMGLHVVKRKKGAPTLKIRRRRKEGREGKAKRFQVHVNKVHPVLAQTFLGFLNFPAAALSALTIAFTNCMYAIVSIYII